jgi:hypothetical protein
MGVPTPKTWVTGEYVSFRDMFSTAYPPTVPAIAAVITRNYKRYCQWCRENEISEYDRRYRFIRERKDLPAISNVQIIIDSVPSWWEPRDFEYVEWLRDTWPPE